MESSAENPIIQRLNEFISYTGLSSTQFADKAGIPRPTLSQMVHGRNKSVNNQMLAKLNENFPELNILWFLFGQGSMLLDNANPSQSPSEVASAMAGTATEPDASEVEPVAPVSKEPSTEIHKMPAPEEFIANGGKWAASVLCTPPMSDNSARTKKIKSIIVFYSDNSFETFIPSEDK